MLRKLVAKLSRWRTPVLVLLGVALIAIAALLGSGWYYSDALKDGALELDHDPPTLDLKVLALDEGRLTLAVTPQTKSDGDWTQDGTFGLEWEDGYGRVGSILEIDDRHVVRQFLPLSANPEVGEMARLDSFAFAGDPLEAFGAPFQEVTFTTPLGNYPAWLVDASRHTWVIFVHGKGADRREALRILPTVMDLGLTTLVITYRNDPEAPASTDGSYQYGQTEWEDLQAGADYAIARGAEKLVLVGYSMGGAIVTSFLYRSPLAERVVGVILDAPMLDFGATVDLAASERGLPGVLTAVGKAIFAFRFDVDWGELNYLERADELTAPVLLFHGDADKRVPVEISDALAEARPDIVTYLRVAGAGHVRSWNADPAGYEAAVRTFLERVIP